MTRGPNPTSRNPYIYLANNGPQPVSEMPLHPKNTDKGAGVRKFNLKANSAGSSASGGGQKTPVYYIDGKHDPETVVRVWVDANPSAVEQLSGWALSQRASKKFRPAIQEVIGFDRDFKPGGPHTDKPCPFCGMADIQSIPRHLPNCEEKP